MKRQYKQSAHSTGSPSPWLTGMLASLYLGLLAALVWWPGSTLLERLRWLDSGVCAQLASHTLYPGGERLPLCSRNTGIYLGFIVTLILLYIIRRGRAQALPPKPLLVVLFSGITLLAIDGVNSFLVDLGVFHLYQPHNLLRLTTGLLTGFAMANLVLPVLNSQFWRDYNDQSSLPSWKQLSFFLPVLLLCFFAATSQSALVLYPLALLSTLGLVVAVSGVNMIALIWISQRDQTFGRYRELLPWLGIAMLAACAELLILAQLKLILLHALGVTLL